MGTAAAENIAIQVDATANTGALATAREDVTALGRAAKESSAGLAEGFNLADESTQKFATHLQESEEGVERSRGAARGLALEFSHLGMAAIEGEGSTMGLIRAVSLAATEMAELSGVAELAASASVLGAVAVAVSTLIALFNSGSKEVEKFYDSLGRLSGSSATVLAGVQQRETAQLGQIRDQIAENNKIMDDFNNARGALSGNAPSIIDNKRAYEENQRLYAQQEELEKHLFELHEMYLKAKEHEDQDAERERERLAKEEQRILEENARKAIELDARMTEEKQSALDKVNLSEEDQAVQKAVREEQRREQEIRDLQISEDEKTKLLLLAQEDRDAQIRAIHKAAADRQAEDDKRRADEAAREAARAREQQVRAIEQSMDAGIRAHESYAQVATKTLLTPLEKYLEGLAASQLIDAAADAASLNFVGAAEHAAVAALALEGARVVAQLGGLNSSGGGAGSGGGAYSGGGSSFTPKDQQGSGSVVVNLLTSDPYSRENIMIASYELGRAGKLNRPIYVPPTTNMIPVGA